LVGNDSGQQRPGHRHTRRIQRDYRRGSISEFRVLRHFDERHATPLLGFRHREWRLRGNGRHYRDRWNHCQGWNHEYRWFEGDRRNHCQGWNYEFRWNHEHRRELDLYADVDFTPQ
jgi:hypothetical protein